MSREEVGSFLGLKIETVSRTFSKFQASGLLFVRQRQIRITDPVGSICSKTRSSRPAREANRCD